MHYIFAVTVVEREKDLFENLGGHLLAEELSLNDAVEELAASAQPRESYGKSALTQ